MRKFEPRTTVIVIWTQQELLKIRADPAIQPGGVYTVLSATNTHVQLTYGLDGYIPGTAVVSYGATLQELFAIKKQEYKMNISKFLRNTIGKNQVYLTIKYWLTCVFKGLQELSRDSLKYMKNKLQKLRKHLKKREEY